MGILFLGPEEEAQGPEVRSDIEEVARGNLPGHDALCHSVFGEGSDEFGELSDADPGNFIDQIGQVRIGLLFEGNSD